MGLRWSGSVGAGFAHRQVARNPVRTDAR